MQDFYEEFQIQHINAIKEDFTGNNGLGRYVILTGSDQRAKDISSRLTKLTFKPHPRHHNLYLGCIPTLKFSIDVAVISTGMGCASLDIILNELIILGARRFLRIGTAGSLQPTKVKVGDIVITTAAVRDEETSSNYIYKEFPAIASLEYILASKRAAFNLSLPYHIGIIHTKSSLYAREFNFSFLQENTEYMKNLHLSGVLASEMETSHLFILSTLNNYKFKNLNNSDLLAGSILTIVGDDRPFSNNNEQIQNGINKGIELGIETIKEMYYIDIKEKNSI